MKGPWRTLLGRLGPSRFLRGDGIRKGPVLLDRSRVFVFPTGHGAVFAGALWLMLLGSINYQASLGQGFTFLLAGIAVVSILHAYHNLAGLTVRAGDAQPVFAGEAARFPVLLGSDSARTRYAVRLRPRGPEAPVPPVDVAPGTTVVHLTRLAKRRGRLQLGRFTVETRFPLGLCRAWTPLEFATECVVYPSPGPARPWPGGPETNGDAGGARTGQGDFVGVRSYRPGDPPGRVHWKRSAHAEALLVKEFGGGGPAEVVFDWEDVPDPDAEIRLSQLCRWVLDAHGAGVAFGLRLPAEVIPVGQGAGHLRRCLGALAAFGEP